MNNSLINACYSSLKMIVSEDSIEIETPDIIRNLIIPRKADTHKGNFGHALLIAGSKGMAGASLLSAKACLRSGVGLLTVNSPAINNTILQICVPEAMVDIDRDEYYYSETVTTDKYSAVGIGPGLGRNSISLLALERQLKMPLRSLVLDADSLNLLSGDKALLQLLPQATVITPHIKELERLVGPWKNNTQMLSMSFDFSKKYSTYIILKGSPTIIISPNGKTYINSTGNSGMSTGGSGDVLTGIVLAFLAQGYNPVDACRISVFAHGMAGDFAAKALSETAMVAENIIDFLPETWLKLYDK